MNYTKEMKIPLQSVWYQSVNAFLKEKGFVSTVKCDANTVGDIETLFNEYKTWCHSRNILPNINIMFVNHMFSLGVVEAKLATEYFDVDALKDND